jgi:hypothetical protein
MYQFEANDPSLFISIDQTIYNHIILYVFFVIIKYF